MTTATTKSQKQTNNKTANQSPKYIGLLYDPQSDGLKDIDASHPALGRRRFAIPKRTDRGDLKYEGITLFPIPFLSYDYNLWQEIKAENPVIDRVIKKGAIQEYVPDITDEEIQAHGQQPQEGTLSAYSVETALELIEANRDPNLLSEWSKPDKRQPIHEAIQSRIEELRESDVALNIVES
jgi:hypothetical protein